VRPDRGGQPRLRRTVRVCLTRERQQEHAGKDLDEIADQLIERYDLRRRQTAAS
jgi:hypothetical protein